MNALGFTESGDPLDVDLDNLIGSHLCVAANSGGGKSGVIRRLLEVTHGRVQQIVLDAEDEFYTLRERFDYVIAGGDGDAPATVANARGLATAALSHDFSLIAQINDLGDDAGEFIAEFITGLLSAPRELWRPVLVVIDEAQRFAPSGAPNEATAAIKSLLQRGRKRGFTAVVATTRFSELNAGVRGLCNNWLLGLVGQSLDRNTAADQLGFGRNSAEAKGLQSLERRQFWAFGPALSRTPVLFRVADTETTIIKHGQARVPTPPAPEALREILAGLATARDEGPTTDDGDLEAKLIRGAEVRQLREARDAFEQRALRAEDLLSGFITGKRMVEGALAAVDDSLKFVDAVAFGASQHLTANGWEAPEEIPGNRPGGGPSGDAGQAEGRAAALTPRATAPAPPARTATEKAGWGNASSADLNGIAQTMLANLRFIWPARLTWQQAAQMVGRSPKSGPYFAAKKQLVAAGVVETNEAQVWAASGTGDGLSVREALDIWGKVLDGFAPRMLVVLSDNLSRTRDELGAAMGVSTKSGPWFGGLKQLRERGLIRESGPVLQLARPVPGERP